MYKNSLYISIYKFSKRGMPITSLEKKWSKSLSINRAKEYSLSRGYARNMLSLIFEKPPLEILLNAPPGKRPKLVEDQGHISISHCENAVLIAFSKYPVGVDIEKKNRNFPAQKVLNRFFSEKEKSLLSNVDSLNLRDSVLNLWVMKEAAFKLSDGKLIKNLNKLIFNDKDQTIEDQTTKFKKRIHLSHFNQWKFAIAYDLKLNDLDPIVCFVE